MKKTDLYRGFDSIKPSKELKAEILKAVKERDKVTVIRRPLFVPIMVVMLVCLNFGMVAKLVICNKSQVNMADLRARTSISQAPEASQEDFVLIEDTRTPEFQSAVDELQEEIDNGEYCLVYEWADNNLNTPSQTWPYYLTNDWQVDYEGDSPALGEYFYRRYAKKRSVMVNLDSDSPTYSEMVCLTNDEVIVGYKGGSTPDKIISITQSDVDTSTVSDDLLAETLKKLNTNAAVSNSLEDFALETMESYDPEYMEKYRYYGVISNMCIYPTASVNEAKILLGCYFSLGFSEEDANKYREMFYVTESGGVIGYKYLPSDPEEYWKETLYRTDAIGSDMVMIPDVIGMDIDEAKKALDDAGLKLGFFTYAAPYSAAYKYNQVMHLTCRTASDITKAGDFVSKGSEVNVTICAESAIWPDDYGQ